MCMAMRMHGMSPCSQQARNARCQLPDTKHKSAFQGVDVESSNFLAMATTECQRVQCCMRPRHLCNTARPSPTRGIPDKACWLEGASTSRKRCSRRGARTARRPCRRRTLSRSCRRGGPPTPGLPPPAALAQRMKPSALRWRSSRCSGDSPVPPARPWPHRKRRRGRRGGDAP